MSSHTWTPEELSSEYASCDCGAWRVVEAQHRSSTMKLTDTLEEQAILESLVEATKPRIPEECNHLSFLLSAPFRYKPYPNGSRFRLAGDTPGVFYCAEESSTAVAELAFYRVLFFSESPATPWPSNPSEYTAFCVALLSSKMLDLTESRFDEDRTELEHVSNYALCQKIESAFRHSGGEVIKYRSIRDPKNRSNFAVLKCSVFRESAPVGLESWKIYLSSGGVRAIREFPPFSVEFDRGSFMSDARLADMRWDRP